MHRTLDPDHITAVIDILLQSDTDSPLAVGLTDRHGSELELGVHPLLGPDPLAELIGFRAPPEWAAFAITGPGRLVDQTSTGATVHVAHLVTREGEAFTRLVTDDSAHELTPPGEPTGRAPDICRRVLALPTPPPPHDTAVLAAGLWLDEILRAILQRDLGEPPMSWPECRALLTPRALPVDQLREFGRSFTQRWPWAIIRRLSHDGPILSVPPGGAEWFDDGSFARWILADMAPLTELRADVVELLGPRVGGRLDGLLDHWLPESHQ